VYLGIALPLTFIRIYSWALHYMPFVIYGTTIGYPLNILTKVSNIIVTWVSCKNFLMKNFLFAVQSSLTLHPNFKVELTPVWDSAGVCVQHICRHTLQS